MKMKSTKMLFFSFRFFQALNDKQLESLLPHDVYTYSCACIHFPPRF